MASRDTVSQKRALLIGINNYTLYPLNYCINDAQEFSKILKSIGFTVTTKINLKSKEFMQTLEEFAKELQPNDLAIFYFAGHAKSITYKNYLLSLDDMISLDSIVQSVGIKCRIKIFIVDSCRRAMKHVEENIQQNLACPTVTPQTLIVYSNCSNITALNETGNGKNGYFMESLLKHVITANIDIQEMFRIVARDIRIQTNQLKRLMHSTGFNENVILVTNDVSGPKNDPRDKRRPMPIPKSSVESDFLYEKQDEFKRSNNIIGVGSNFSDDSIAPDKQKPRTDNSINSPHGVKPSSQPKYRLAPSVSLPQNVDNNAREGKEGYARVPERAHYSPNAYQGPYRSEMFGVDQHTMDDVRGLFKCLTQSLPIMNKQGPMSGQCIPETDQMESFLKRNFGFHNIDGQYIVSGVRAFELSKPISGLDPNKNIYFPHDQYHSPFIMTVAEILKWQNSYVVYADRNVRGMDKEFLRHALQGRSKNGSEAFRMKFVVRMSDCPILMKFDAKILPRSLHDDWSNRIKLVSVTGIDFAGREHDVDDITTYIRNWQQVFELDQRTDKPKVFHGRDFYPVRSHPEVQLDEKRLLDDLMKMVRIRLYACNMEGVEIVVETGIGLGVFAGKHLGIDGRIRQLSAFAIREVLQNEGATFRNIRAVVFALPIFAKDRNGRQLPDTYNDFVYEFTKRNYSGPIPVLIADQDMHELTVAIARQKFRVSQLNPADSHGVFGEYWQNHGPAVEEKLALTTLGLLVQHHLINENVLNPNRYKII